MNGQLLSQQFTSASTVLQTCWRGTFYCRVFRTKQNLATTLAALFKGNKVRVQLREQNQHAASIQSFFRHKSAQSTRMKQLAAVTKIQGLLRTFRVASLHQQKIICATKIQAWFRANDSRCKFTRKLYFELSTQSFLSNSRAISQSTNTASKHIQSQWRTHTGRLQYSRMREHLVSLQSRVRGYLARVHATKKTKQIIVIQKLTRRAQKRTHYFKFRRGIKLLQGHVRARRLRGELHFLKCTITMLQAHARRLLKRRKFLRLQHGVVALQSQWRSIFGQRRYRGIVKGIVRVQNQIRRNFVYQEFVYKRDTVRNLQRICRLGLARRRLLEQKKQKDKESEVAVLVLQAKGRGYAVRRRLQHLHERASNIQRVFRGFLAEVDYHMKLNAIMVFQSLARRWLAKQMASTKKAVIVRIHSSVTSSFSNQCTQKVSAKWELRLQQVQSAVRIQRLVRGYRLRQNAKTERAAQSIQKCWRCYTVHVEFLIVILGTMSIQAYSRGLMARKRLRRQHAAALRIQRFVRGLLVRQKAKSERHARQFGMKRSIALVLQRLWRGSRGKAKASKKRTDGERNLAAIEIQRFWRGYSQNVSYLLMIFSAVRIEQHARVFLAKKCKAMLEEERLELVRPIVAAVIQSAVRKYFARGAFRQVVRKVTAFQSCVRGHRVRKKCTKKVREALGGIEKANLKAWRFPHMQLGARTVAALAVIRTSTRLCQIMTEVASLEIATRYSRSW